MHSRNLYKNRSHVNIILEILTMLFSAFTVCYEKLTPILHGCFDASLALCCNVADLRLNASIFITRAVTSTKH